MKKFFLIAFYILCVHEIFAQDTTKHECTDVNTGVRFYSASKPRQYMCAEIQFPSVRPLHALFTMQYGFDHPAKYTTTTEWYGGLYFGKDNLYFTWQTGLHFSFNGGYGGYSPAKIKVGGKYCILRKVRGSYVTDNQYTVTTDYDVTHIIIRAQESDFVRSYTEVNLNVTKFLSIGYAAQFFKETSKKDVVLNGVRSSIPIQSDSPRGPLLTLQYKNLYFKSWRTWNSDQKFTAVIGYRLAH